MSPRRSPGHRARPTLLWLLATVAAAVLAGCGGSHHAAPVHLPGRLIRVGSPVTAPAVPSGFVGVSMEEYSLPYHIGTDPAALDPVFLQLMRNIAPGQRPVLRLGGDSTDKSWIASAGGAEPIWDAFTFTPDWFATARALATTLNAQMIVGVNLEAGSAPLAAAEGRAIVDGLGRSHVAALELGNEPELYSSFNWYRTAEDVGIKGRSASWTPAAYAAQAAQVAKGLPDVPVAGPAIGSQKWISQLPAILTADHAISLVTLHRYPLKKCTTATHVTAAQLLAPSSSVGLANGLRRAIHTAAQFGHPLRLAEMNSISCGGQAGLSDSFASALWSLDTLFALAKVGVTGVNFHTSPAVTNHLFTFSHAGGEWHGTVYPIYYGILMFAKAVPAGSELLRVKGADPANPVWAARTPNGQENVVIENQQASGTETFSIAPPAQPTRSARLTLLTAPGLLARTGVTLGGQSFPAGMTSGKPAGTSHVTTLGPDGDAYVVHVPAHSAALLEIP